jgi:hypothetical protein
MSESDALDDPIVCLTNKGGDLAGALVSLSDTRTFLKIRFLISDRHRVSLLGDESGERRTAEGIARVVLLSDAFSLCSFCTLHAAPSRRRPDRHTLA